jgi:hypothetical protein
MDNPEALTETEKTKKEKPQHRTLKDEQNTNLAKNRG